MSFSSDIQATVHNFDTMLAGKSTFSQFVGEEGALVEADIAKLPVAVEGLVQAAWDGVKAGASVLVGAGETALGPIIAESSDTQATQVQNLLSLAGINPGIGPLSLAEHAALVTIINGLKTNLDRIGIHVTLAAGVTANAPSSGAQVAPAPIAAPAAPEGA